MRIDFVITELFVGGAEKCLTELALGLHDRGDQVRVFSLQPLPEGPQRRLVERLENAGIRVASAGADSIGQFFKTTRLLQDWLREDPPELVQTFLFHANVIGTRAARRSSVPACVGGIRVAEPNKLRILLERNYVAKMDRIICVSDQVREFAMDHLRAPPDSCFTIANGVDANRYSTASPLAWSTIGWPDDAVVSLFIGRLHPQKGIDVLQRQIDQLAPRDENKKLLIVGDGPLAASLDDWIESVGKDRVVRLPWQADVASLMRACRLLILPSYYEGMPNVVLEAMAAGRPVVCSRVEGSRELLAHRWEQQSFPVGDERALKNLVASLLNDEALADELGAANQHRVTEQFSLARMVDAYQHHYRALVAERSV